DERLSRMGGAAGGRLPNGRRSSGISSPVLVVDDNKDVRDSSVMLLETLGYQVIAAGDGAEALSILRGGSRPRLILLDLQMPVMDGFAFRAEQRRDPAISDIPVVIYSGHYDVHAHAGALAAQGYLTKPMDVDALVEFIEACPG